MKLSEEQAKEVKRLFNSWMSIKEDSATLSKEMKDIKEQAASVMECKKTLVTKLFSFLKRKYEAGVDEIDELYELSESIE